MHSGHFYTLEKYTENKLKAKVNADKRGKMEFAKFNGTWNMFVCEGDLHTEQ